MLKLLIKLFIKNSEDVSNPAVRRAYGTLCSLYGVFLNVLLFAGKYFAGLVTGSVAILADAFNNLSDAGSSIITLLGFALAGRKSDLEHPFGHGRIEYLTGLALSVLIILMGVELGKSSVEKILSPEPVEVSLASALILVCSIAVKFYMSRYNRTVGRRINSAAMQATAADSLSDAVATAVVLASMGVAWLFSVNIDAWAGLLVALFIVYAGFNAAKETLSPLLGQAPDPSLVRDIAAVVTAHPEIVGIHDMIIHDYGPGRSYVSLHAEVDGSGDIFALHDAIDLVEREIREKFNIFATIHMDPIDVQNPEVASMRAAVGELLKDLHPAVTVHDFRMVPGPTHTNLIFDVLLPADYPESDEQVAERVKALVNTTWENHYAVVTIDRSYVK